MPDQPSSVNLRVVITGPLYGRGGRETHLLHLGRLLISKGHEVVLASRYADRSVPLVQLNRELNIRRLTTPFDKRHKDYRWSTIFAMLLWPLYLIRHRADIIITLEFSRFLKFLALFAKPSTKIIWIRAGLPVEPMESIDEDVLSRINGVIVETVLQAQASQIAHPLLPTRTIPLLGNISKEIPTRRSLEHHTILHLAYLGRYDVKKGIYRLLEIWDQLQVTDVHLHFYGHGPEQEKLQAEIIRRGMDTTITVHDGWKTPAELASIMGMIDLIILPSEEEGLPVVLMEAMAYGVPFVATDVGAVCTYAEENPDVRIVPLDNKQIAFAIAEMIQAIRNRQINGQRLQQYYEDRYAFDKLAKGWLETIETAALWTR